MTTDERDQRDERELRDLLTRRAEVREDEVEALREFVAALPARRRRRPGLGLLAAAAGVTVLLGAGVVLANFHVRTGSTGLFPPDPAAFANDPRLAVCNATPENALAIFELPHVSDYAAALPHAYPLIGLQADPNAPALVIVFKGPGGGDRFGSPAPAGSHDLCMVVGADAAHWAPVGIVGVDITGLAGLEGLPPEPAPSGTPIAAEDQPWVDRCGGVAAGINRVLHLAHGTDALTLNSIAVPASAMSDQPITIVEYTGAHPFSPQGTTPPAGTTFTPREPLQPGERDLCILTGSDPATATRTIVEYGTQFAPGPPPSLAPATATPNASPPSAPPTTPAPSAGPASSPPDASASEVAGCAMPSLPYDSNDIHDDGGTYSGLDAPIPIPLVTGWELVPSVADSSLGGAGLVLPAHAPMGLPLSVVLSKPDAVSIFYVKGDLAANDTALDLLDRPGAQLTISKAHGNDAQHVIDTVGSFANPITVGPYPAAIVHSSTMPNGIRYFAVYWSNGTFDYDLAVNSSAAEAIRTAQAIYCP